LRIGLCKTIIKPVVTYGAEAWTLMIKVGKGLCCVEKEKSWETFMSQHIKMVPANKN